MPDPAAPELDPSQKRWAFGAAGLFLLAVGFLTTSFVSFYVARDSLEEQISESTLPLTRIVTALPASAVPLKSGVVSVVGLVTVTVGTPGAVVSITTVCAALGPLTLLAASVAVTVMSWLPSVSVDTVMV